MGLLENLFGTALPEKSTGTILISGIVSVSTIISVFIAIKQWIKNGKQKRAEYQIQLITKIRDDEDIAVTMELIDWNKIEYYGEWEHKKEIDSDHTKGDKKDLFKKIDKTLSHFSYICFLRKKHLISQNDMAVFEYELKRLFDNCHIVNYLYTLQHWSEHLGVRSSFFWLIWYGKRCKYLSKKDFDEKPSKGKSPSGKYQYFLQNPRSYHE